MPLLPVVAPGVAAGVAGDAGVTPVPPTAFPPCWPFIPFALCAIASFSEMGGVKSPAPPGKDSDEVAVKARACCALEGWVVRESIEWMFGLQPTAGMQVLEMKEDETIQMTRELQSRERWMRRERKRRRRGKCEGAGGNNPFPCCDVLVRCSTNGRCKGLEALTWEMDNSMYPPTRCSHVTSRDRQSNHD